MVRESMPIGEPPAFDMPVDDLGRFDGGTFDIGGMYFDAGDMGIDY